MWKNERHQRISRILDDLGQVKTDHLVEELDVSRETIRRDLLEMERHGLLERVHGGAVVTQDREEPPLSIRQGLNVKEKIAIAKAASALITHHKVVFFDAGSTTLHLAQQLAGLRNLHVITNFIDAAQSLHGHCEGSSRITLLGGNLTRSGFATSGCQTIREIGRITADLAFVSPAAIDLGKGALNADEEEADIAAAMLANSRQNVILANAAKLSARGNFGYCEFAQMDVLITDASIRKQPGVEDRLRERVGSLIIA
ncbi:MAG: DeoR/GlpR family DNA-binding transcription regulator [Roseovarius sp.]|nr:DeoR/GlpR family DNA-binding transcription regulator [Roseovarius sp.]